MCRKPVVIGIALVQMLIISKTAAAQNDSIPHPTQGAKWPRALIAPVGIGISYAIDPEVRELILHQHSRSLDRLAKVANALGTGQRLVPAMAVTYAAAFLTGHESLANGTLNTAAAYIASDLAESVLKPVIGR